MRQLLACADVNIVRQRGNFLDSALVTHTRYDDLRRGASFVGHRGNWGALTIVEHEVSNLQVAT